MDRTTLGSFLREEARERERSGRIGARKWTSSGDSREGATRPVARTQAYRRYRLQRALEWLISDAPSNVSHGHEEGKEQVYIPDRKNATVVNTPRNRPIGPGSSIQRPWETYTVFVPTLTFYFSRGGRLPAIVI